MGTSTIKGCSSKSTGPSLGTLAAILKVCLVIPLFCCSCCELSLHKLSHCLGSLDHLWAGKWGSIPVLLTTNFGPLSLHNYQKRLIHVLFLPSTALKDKYSEGQGNNKKVGPWKVNSTREQDMLDNPFLQVAAPSTVSRNKATSSAKSRNLACLKPYQTFYLSP